MSFIFGFIVGAVLTVAYQNKEQVIAYVKSKLGK